MFVFMRIRGGKGEFLPCFQRLKSVGTEGKELELTRAYVQSG